MAEATGNGTPALRVPGADWLIVDLHGAYPAYSAPPLQLMLTRTESLEALAARLDRIGSTPWVAGVLVTVTSLDAGLATTHAIARMLGRLAERKHVVGYLPHVDMRSLLATASLGEVVAPESADVSVPGLAAEQVFVGELLRRAGITVENLRIREYKSALTRFSDDHMDEFNREQLTAYLTSAERTWLAALAQARGADPARAEQWLEARFTSAAQLLDAGLITRIAYDDEIATPADQQWARTLTLMMPRRHSASRSSTAPPSAALPRPARMRRTADGVAVVPVIGAIVPGRSRPAPPIPARVPFVPAAQAGAETVVAALRRAERDPHTKAVLLYVDSGGGSALASDLIDRAVATSTKPVVAVMGEVAASGGYYVLARADHVVASPFTVTGSIGVVVGKPVLEEFSARRGITPETVGRQQALLFSPFRGFSPEERAWAEQMMREVYDRFVDRVATGRHLTRERVDEIGRGRIWSGVDARSIGLVDELGDLDTGLAAARRLAGLPDEAPVRTLSAGFQLPGAPALARPAAAGTPASSPAALLTSLWPFGDEHVLTWLDWSVTIR